MMLKRIFLLCFLGGFTLTAVAMETAENDILASSAYWGMGRSGGALKNLPGQVWINPSLVPDDFYASLSANISLLPADIRVSRISGRYKTGRHVFSAGINYEHYGEFEERNTDGDLTGTFNAGRTQYFSAWSLELSSKLSLGVSTRYLSDFIDDSRDGFGMISYGIIMIPVREKTQIGFVYSDFPEPAEDEIRIAISHPLQYIPLTLNLDYRYRGTHALRNLTVGGYFESSEDLQFMAGLDLRRGGLQTDNLGQDYIAGLALGGRYIFKGISLELSAFSYGGLGTVTSLGVSYYHGL